MKDARGETGAAIEMGMFVAGEGRRFYGRTTTSAVPNKTALTVRQPLGVAGLIIAANTPIANVAWKVFPALLCGNTAVLKAAEDTPLSAWAFARLAGEAGPSTRGAQVVHGFGEEAGAPLVESPDVDIISFTGSTAVGRLIAQTAGARLAKVCLELGGQEPACGLRRRRPRGRGRTRPCSRPSATPGSAAPPAAASSCSTRSTSEFREMLLERVAAAARGHRRRGRFRARDQRGAARRTCCDAVEARHARRRPRCSRRAAGSTGTGYDGGYFMAPTLLENAAPDAEISRTELFGPISVLYRVPRFEEALALANDSPYGLTASIHTGNMHRAMTFLTGSVRAWRS